MSELIEKLNQPIPFEQVKWRRQGGGNVLYVPGEFVFQAMNEVFGNDGWGYEATVHFISEGTNAKGNHVVNYRSEATVTLAEVSHMYKHDHGFGQGIDKDLGKAHESAIKEAVTDAVKRACRSLGPRVGLYLYFAEGRVQSVLDMIQAATSLEQLTEIYKANLFRDGTDEHKRLLEALSAKKKEL